MLLAEFLAGSIRCSAWLKELDLNVAWVRLRFWALSGRNSTRHLAVIPLLRLIIKCRCLLPSMCGNGSV